MIAFEEYVDIRFGCGLSPVAATPRDVNAILAGLTGPDKMATQYPLTVSVEPLALLRGIQEGLKQVKRGETQALRDEGRAKLGELRRQAVIARDQQMIVAFRRWINTDTAMRERLVHFWTDHFTVEARNKAWEPFIALFSETAIRPHVGGKFKDMLMAVATNPAMLHYLDQINSAGPDSMLVQRNPQRGLNENLAREILELHTIGVDGPYTQNDVRSLALMLTGLSHDAGEFMFRDALVQNGEFELLGKRYSRDGGFEMLEDVFRDLTAHPATARHIGRKLAQHFISDAGVPELEQHVSARFAESGGDLNATITAMLEHPAAWQGDMANVKPPVAYVGSGLRALNRKGVDPIGIIRNSDVDGIRKNVIEPLNRMGQPWQSPSGPDGWPENDEAWITPAGIAGRVQWAMRLSTMIGRDIPDPREFVRVALGSAASRDTIFAATAAETRAEGVGLVLISPDFQLR